MPNSLPSALGTADNPLPIAPGTGTKFPVMETYTPLGFQQLTALGAAQALTVPTSARVALLQAETADVRWRDDGTAPTATVGMLLAVGTVLLYTGDLAALQAIETAAGAQLNISYYS